MQRSTSPDNQSFNPNRMSRFVSPLIIAGIAVAALTGCTANAAPSPEHTTSASATPHNTPEATATPRASGGDFERPDALPASLEAADKASPDEFAKLPKKEQIQWATWAGQYKQEFIKFFSMINDEPQNAAYTLTENSDVKALLADRSYEERIAINFGEGTPSGRQYNGQLDTDMATKYMMAFTITDANGISHINRFINTAASNNDNQAVNAGQQAGTDMFDTVAEIKKAQDFNATSNHMMVDGESIPSFFVSYTDSQGSATYDIAAYKTVDYKNQPIVVSLVAEQQSAQ
jgi:hypothetical protein